MTLTYERAAAIKRVMDGHQQPQNEAQAAFIQQVRSVHLGSQHDTTAKHVKAVEQSKLWKQRIKDE